ncbi:MAG: signal recognition particle-docking protein FtsY [Deltaproteobacteria bacterium]|nr:signal recognition particle-docking protein FtsY [Deltaproteobacteria bacterium]
MDTTTILLIVAGVIVLALVFFFMRKGGEPERLEDAPEPAKKPKPEPRQADEARAEAKAAEKPKAEAKAKAKAAEDAPQEEAADEPAADAAAEASDDSAETELGDADHEDIEEMEAQEAPPSVPAGPPKEASAEEIAALRKGLASTRGGFISRLAGLFKKKKTIDPEELDELLAEMEEVLITSDLGVKVADKILERLKAALQEGTIADGEAAYRALRAHAEEILTRSNEGAVKLENQPTVLLVVGVNGVGKTTTIGKLAKRLTDEGKSVLLAAGDTFRAAAVIQLEMWGRRTNCEVVKGKGRADPASVIFDAVKKGAEMGVDVIIADTAGRLHTKTPLMEEIKKVGRTVEKALGRPADEVLLVLDATTGQNAIQQSDMFREALPISGLVLTKLDGTAKGGVILGIVDTHDVPVRYVGIGERVEDLKEFDASAFVEALFERPPEAETVAAEEQAAT